METMTKKVNKSLASYDLFETICARINGEACCESSTTILECSCDTCCTTVYIVQYGCAWLLRQLFNKEIRRYRGSNISAIRRGELSVESARRIVKCTPYARHPAIVGENRRREQTRFRHSLCRLSHIIAQEDFPGMSVEEALGREFPLFAANLAPLVRESDLYQTLKRLYTELLLRPGQRKPRIREEALYLLFHLAGLAGCSPSSHYNLWADTLSLDLFLYTADAAWHRRRIDR